MTTSFVSRASVMRDAAGLRRVELRCRSYRLFLEARRLRGDTSGDTYVYTVEVTNTGDARLQGSCRPPRLKTTWPEVLDDATFNDDAFGWSLVIPMTPTGSADVVGCGGLGHPNGTRRLPGHRQRPDRRANQRLDSNVVVTPHSALPVRAANAALYTAEQPRHVHGGELPPWRCRAPR